MKKCILSLAAFAAVFCLCSCDEDKIGGNSDNTLTFVLEGSETRATRSAVSMPLSVEEFADDLVLTETVSSLDDLYYADADGVTRGTPAYTENVVDLYQKFNGVAYSGTSVYLADTDFPLTVSEGKIQGSHCYPDEAEWPANGTLQFFLRMPVTECTALNPTYNTTTGAISFSGYTQPADAVDQKDLLFTSKTIKEKDSDRSLTFLHPLTGVKFSIGTNLGEHVVGITKIQFNNLAKQGNCTITPVSGSKSADCVVWSNLTGTTSCAASFTDAEAKGQNLSGKSGFPTSFDAADVNKSALNDAAFTKTFFLIPQTIGDDVTVTYTILKDDGKTATTTIKFGEALKKGHKVNGTPTAVEWKAGELRTYTINVKNPYEIEIEEEFNEVTKSNVTVANTGSCELYIRAYIVANWYKDGVMVAPYNGEGKFTGLTGSNWVKGADGFYYYTKPVPGSTTITDKLFDSFTYDDKTAISVEGAHLEMEIAAQGAIAEGKTSYTDAWGL